MNYALQAMQEEIPNVMFHELRYARRQFLLISMQSHKQLEQFAIWHCISRNTKLLKKKKKKDNKKL